MAKKTKAITSRARGIAHYPRLNDPDTKFHDAGIYKADLRIGSEEAQKLIAKIQKWAVDLMGEELPVSDTIIKKKGKYRPNEDNNVFQPDFDKDTGEMTGDWIFSFRVKNQYYKDKKTGEQRLWERRPAMFSASGKPASKAKVGAGTDMAVSFTVYIGKIASGELYMALQPDAVQIYKLVAWAAGESSASDFGFEAEEGWDPEDDFSDDDGPTGNEPDEEADDEDDGSDDF